MFEDLNSEKKFDKVQKLLIQKEKNFKLGDINTRVLLSSFLFKNFREHYLLNENDELYQLALTITDSLVQNNFKKVTEEYERYYEKFIEWRNRDIELMKMEIMSARQQLNDMKVIGEQLDDAEQQWNDGLTHNIEKMKNSENLLDIYRKSLPQCRKRC